MESGLQRLDCWRTYPPQREYYSTLYPDIVVISKHLDERPNNRRANVGHVLNRLLFGLFAAC
ncbi:MAG: hypothetical protein M1274_00380 [Actinobacteria bacterium]|nr:hypothetical protein [Actinomycetota bacterium]